MSMGGSIMGYENNNDVNHAKCRKSLKALPVVSSINTAGVTSTGFENGGIHAAGRSRKSGLRTSVVTSRKSESCSRGHVNNLWSVWYGIIAVVFQAYIAIRCTRRFIAYLSLPWPADAPPPKIELHVCLALAGAGVLLLPIFLAAAFLKLGNLANDGIKLGRHLSTCSRDPSSSLLGSNTESGVANNLWRHGGPTAAFVHLCTAMCFLLPSLLMEARLIHAGFLPKDAIWRTDLDWVVVHRDRLVVLSFMNIPENLSLNLGHYGISQSALDDDIDVLINGTNNSSTLIPTKLSSVLLSVQTSNAPTSAVRSTTNSAAKVEVEAPSDFFIGSLTGSSLVSSAPISPTTSAQLTSKRPISKINVRNIQRNRLKAKKNLAASKSKPTSNGGGGGDRTWAGNMSAQSLPLTFNSLADLDHPENFNLDSDEAGEDYGPITLEYLNYVVALGVYSVRYPAVFWSSNKVLGTIFSIQLVANAAQSLLAYAGMSVLYKVQVVGPLKVLPLLRHRTVTAASSAISSFFGDRFFLLNPHVTLGIFVLSSLLVLCSSMVMYLYAYGRFVAFLNQERERRVIMSKDERSEDAGWIYITHPAALCLFLAIAICSAPLLYDYTVVYRGSLDGAILACIVSTVLHLILWLMLWVFLTIKHRWTFKLRVTIGRATVKSTRSVKLLTDVDLVSGRDDDDGSGTPLLVVGNGRTYTVSDTSPKKAIINVIQKAAMERKARLQGINNMDVLDGESMVDGDEQIYWLRPKLRSSPMKSGDSVTGPGSNQVHDKGWLNKKLKPKVTFNDLPSTSGSRNKGKVKRGIADGGPEDDGDYATLRELPLVASHDIADDNISEENKLLECVNDDRVTYYASGNHDLQPSENESVILSSSEGLPKVSIVRSLVENRLPLPIPPPTPIVGPENNVFVHSTSSGQIPRCLRRADSGMPHEELTPRSDSSNSPPLDVIGPSNNSTSSNSETSSSGVHSNGSNTSSQRRANSVEDLGSGEPKEEAQWRSCSLQRGIQPPGPSVGTMASKNSRLVVNATPSYAAVYGNGELLSGGCPAVIMENPNEATVVIRRKAARPKLQEPLALGEEPFGRSTNMRMTSFTETNDLRTNQASSATLPHYPTQPVVTYPHCSTMPLPHATSHSNGVLGNTNMSGSSGSCGSVLRYPGHLETSQQQHLQPPPPVHGTVPSHTTLPSHHNGVRLMPQSSTNPFLKRFPSVQPIGGHISKQQQQHQQQQHQQEQSWTAVLPSTANLQHPHHHHHHHHTFPQAPIINGKLTPATQPIGRQSDRDSANFSMASSGDSDTCLPH